MSKPKKAPRTPNPVVAVANHILTEHLDPQTIYGAVLDLKLADFEAMENAILGPNPCLAGTTIEDQRVLAREEAMFLLGLEIGRRIGGVR